MVFLCAAYYAAGGAGLHFATIGSAVSLVWPPTGLAIAALVLWGPWMAIPVAAGAFLVNYEVVGSVPVASALAVGNALEAVIGAWLLGWFRVDSEFRRRRDVLGLGIMVAVAPLVSAAIGTLALALFGVVGLAEVPVTALQWWAGDASGAILLVPLLLTASVARDRSVVAPLVALNLAIAASSFVAFELFSGTEATLALAILPYGFLLWSALRYGALGASSTAFTLSAAIVVCTAAGLGPFAGGTSAKALWSMWSFVAVTGTFSLVLTALDNERVATEAAHLQLERRFRHAFESAPTGMAILGADHRLIAANTTFRHLIGSADPVGSMLARWTNEAGRERLAQSLAAPASREAHSVSVLFRSETGVERHCLVRSTTLPGFGWGARLVHLEDVTPARLAERDRQRLTEQLVHSQRMDGIGQLAGGVAHDLNNILQAVTGNLELIGASKAGDPRQTQWVGAARHATNRASALTRQLLAFSRRAPMVPEVLDLREVVHRAVGMLAPLLPSRMTLELDVAEGLFVLADEPQIEQVLMNLVVNARDAMGAQGRILVVGWRVPESGWIELFVEDEGPGIAPELRDRVFEPFFTTKPLGKGTGLGLAVAYGIAHAHGGRIWAEDGAHGGGARVIMSLPPAETHGAGVDERPFPPPAVTRQRTVLIAEDDPDVLEVAEQLLRAEGYAVLTARDGVEAIERFRGSKSSIDACVFDVVMPRLSGAEALRAIVAEVGSLPTVLVSGYARDLADPVLLKGMGVEFLSKPYTQAQLAGAISRALVRDAQLAQPA